MDFSEMSSLNLDFELLLRETTSNKFSIDCLYKSREDIIEFAKKHINEKISVKCLWFYLSTKDDNFDDAHIIENEIVKPEIYIKATLRNSIDTCENGIEYMRYVIHVRVHDNHDYSTRSYHRRYYNFTGFNLAFPGAGIPIENLRVNFSKLIKGYFEILVEILNYEGLELDPYVERKFIMAQNLELSRRVEEINSIISTKEKHVANLKLEIEKLENKKRFIIEAEARYDEIKEFNDEIEKYRKAYLSLEEIVNKTNDWKAKREYEYKSLIEAQHRENENHFNLLKLEFDKYKKEELAKLELEREKVREFEKEKLASLEIECEKVKADESRLARDFAEIKARRDELEKIFNDLPEYLLSEIGKRKLVELEELRDMVTEKFENYSFEQINKLIEYINQYSDRDECDKFYEESGVEFTDFTFGTFKPEISDCKLESLSTSDFSINRSEKIFDDALVEDFEAFKFKSFNEIIKCLMIFNKFSLCIGRENESVLMRKFTFNFIDVVDKYYRKHLRQKESKK